MHETRFEDTCQIASTNSDVSVLGEILTFRAKNLIIATIQRSAKVTLRWDERVGCYVGSLGGVEFRSDGPKAHTYRTHR